MLNTQPVAILWDDAHIWGLMALRALRALDFPVRLLKGLDIAHGALFRKQGCLPEPAFPLLVVPGGSAALKASALGTAGKKAICDFVAAGGRYLGFCGGAGLALSHSRGLGLCPWGRDSYPERILHLISGHILASPCKSELTPQWDVASPSLPVWWPGRFCNGGGDVEVLARGKSPDTDFWVADLPLESVPKHVFAQWRELYGVNLSADFLAGTELVVHGLFGRGEYILSYSHLETPDSPDANRWFCHLLGKLTGTPVRYSTIPSWELLPDQGVRDNHFDDKVQPLIAWAASSMRSLVELGIRHRLFFRRTSWLIGWKPGLPGSLCDNLLAALGVAERTTPTPEAALWWSSREKQFRDLAEVFFARSEGYLLAARLSDTLTSTMPDAVDRSSLNKERDLLFGHPMTGGGMLGSMQSMVEEYLFLCLHTPEGLQEN